MKRKLIKALRALQNKRNVFSIEIEFFQKLYRRRALRSLIHKICADERFENVSKIF